MIMLGEPWKKAEILKKRIPAAGTVPGTFQPERWWYFPKCDSHVTGSEKISNEMMVSPAPDKIINRSFFHPHPACIFLKKTVPDPTGESTMILRQ